MSSKVYKYEVRDYLIGCKGSDVFILTEGCEFV